MYAFHIDFQSNLFFFSQFNGYFNVERRSSESTSQRSGLNQNPEVILMAKSWLSVHKCQTEIQTQRQSYGGVRVAFYMCEAKREHFRDSPW